MMVHHNVTALGGQQFCDVKISVRMWWGLNIVQIRLLTSFMNDPLDHFDLDDESVVSRNF